MSSTEALEQQLRAKGNCHWRRACALGLVLTACAGRAFAVACTTQAEMKAPERTALVDAARDLGNKIQTGNVDGVKAKTIASVAGNFDTIAGTIRNLAPQLTGATLRVTSVYALDASDAAPGQDQVQFFCGQGARVTFSIPQLPPGRYAFASIEATGVKAPERLALLLQNVGPSMASPSWQLAGFFPRPLLAAGHDGVWYWTKARDFHKQAQNWNAYFYYEAAQHLLLPADFLSSTNLEKLGQEASSVMPAGLPGTEGNSAPNQPNAPSMTIPVAGTQVKITNLHTDASFGGLDLVINYEAADVADPVKARAATVALMKALLALHPELKDAFHGLWVFANAPNQRPFALEMPMAQIAAQS